MSDNTPLLFLKPSVGAATDEPPTTLPIEVGATEPTGLSEEVGNEPPTKRLKINQLEMAHVDEVDVVQSCDLDVSMFGYEIGGDDNDLYVATTGELALIYFGFLSLRKNLMWNSAYWLKWMHLQISSK